MPEIFPEYMGYDRTIAVFSPDGRLFQVEYAKEAVKKGSTVLGIVFKDGVLLVSVKPSIPLLVPSSAEKIFPIDDHIVSAAAGLLADARNLVRLGRIRAQIHRLTFDEPIDVWGLARVIGDRMQLSTLYAGLRPFGVGLLIGGVDKTGPHLIESDPSGMLYEWKARAIGKGSNVANKILIQKWKENLKLEEALKLGIETIKKSEKVADESLIEVAIVEKGKKFRLTTVDKVKI